MDSLIASAARALAQGDALRALKSVSLRDDPPALALRGIAMAQLGEFVRARALLRTAWRRFGTGEAVARARCVVAEAEVALAMRDFAGPPRALSAAADVLSSHADHANATQARAIALRRLLLLGRVGDAATERARIDDTSIPAPLAAVVALADAELAMRSLRIDDARRALDGARKAAGAAQLPALLAEVAEAQAMLERPAARRLSTGAEETLRLSDVAALLRSDAIVVDACRRGVRAGGAWTSLARRPDETHRARLRVEMGRLRALIKPLATLDATPRGFALRPLDGRAVVLLAPPIEGDQASLLALLADGAAWSTSALSLALDASQRTVQRALSELEAEGGVRSIGHARARRWLAPTLAGFTTILLLPAAPKA